MMGVELCWVARIEMDRGGMLSRWLSFRILSVFLSLWSRLSKRVSGASSTYFLNVMC